MKNSTIPQKGRGHTSVMKGRSELIILRFVARRNEARLSRLDEHQAWHTFGLGQNWRE